MRLTIIQNNCKKSEQVSKSFRIYFKLNNFAFLAGTASIKCPLSIIYNSIGKKHSKRSHKSIEL